VGYQISEAAVDRTAGGSVELEPGGRIGEDHAAAPRGG
jgi:hypothetical protein